MGGQRTAADREEVGALVQRARALGLATHVDELDSGAVPEHEAAAPLYSRLRQVESPLRAALSEYRAGEMSLEEALATLEDAAELLVLAEEAAAKPKPGFVRDWTNPTEVLLPELTGMKRAAEMLTLRSLARADSGDAEGALRDFEAVFAIGAHLSAESMIIGNLAYGGLLSDWCRLAAELATRFQNDHTTLHRILVACKNLPEPDFRSALGTEMAANRRIIEQLTAEEVAFSQLYAFVTPGENWGGFMPSDRTVARYAWKAEAHIIRHYVEIAEAWGDHEEVSDREMRSMKTLEDARGEPGIAVALILTPYVSPLHYREREAITLVRTTRIGVAAAYMRARDGAWPSLFEAARVGEVDPTDAFLNSPLVYRAGSDGLGVYGLGPNGVDNDGLRRIRGSGDYDVAIVRIGN